MFGVSTSPPLARLRVALDVMPSPLEERPGLLLRDPYRFTDAVMILPPPLVPLLALFDGGHDVSDLKLALVRRSGDLAAAGLADELIQSLSRSGFLEDETFHALREARERDFAAAPQRAAAHAGSAYPDQAVELSPLLERYLGDGERAPAADGLIGIAAPHVSPAGGVDSYRAAYRALRGVPADRTCVVLGTSHYGVPDCFGLTRKPFVTPLGTTRSDPELLERLAQVPGAALLEEDYCHAVEHSIEFQVIFLQHVFGPRVKVLPVLCGPFLAGMQAGLPEEHEGVGRVLEALAAIASAEPAPLFVLGVDMAHIGRRYGDAEPARADQGRMQAVAARDRERIQRLEEGDAEGFWELVREGGEDDLRWCGASPLYTFLRAVPAKGRLLHYQQWNIDAASVVSFAGLLFTRKR